MPEVFDPVRIGLVSISDRASSGVYEDKGIPALHDWLSRALIRQARKDAAPTQDEISKGQAPRRGRSYREIFQLVRDALEQEEDA